MKIYIASVVVLTLGICNIGYTQTFDGLRVSLKGGAVYSQITNLETTILSEPFFINYTLKNNRKFGFTGGFGINWEIKNSIVAVSLDAIYAQQAAELVFNNYQKDFNYNMQFNYQYLNFPLLVKVYPFEKSHDGLHGFTVGAGVQAGLNLASENIVYSSGGSGRLPAFGSDLAEQQQLRNVLKGKNNFGVLFHIGYEIFNPGINIELRYVLGLTDVVATQVNSYNFIENKNVNNTLQFTIGWDFLSTYPKKSVLFVRQPKS